VKVRAAAPVLLAVLLSGCAAGVDEPGTGNAAAASSEPSSAAASPTTTATASTAPSTAAPAAPSPTAPPAPQVRTIDVGYAGGQVTGTSGREQVRLGEQVVLRVSSDVPEQVHVHGYDLEVDVPAGGSADIPVTASIPGVFEVELHESGKVLYQLRVA
jgi:hypothetical protein